MMSEVLIVTIPPPRHFYSLYADGLYSSKQYFEDTDKTELAYDENAALFLYYTYPTHRRVYLVRNAPSADDERLTLAALPGLSKTVRVLFKQIASRVDKTKHAVSYLNEHHGGAYGFPDIFYYRLNALLSLKGKLSYPKIDALVKL